ncbi:MAG: SAM-dependent methyltransferase [Myxococcota bacterium]
MPSRPKPPLDAARRHHTCWPGREAALLGELTRVFPRSRHFSNHPGTTESLLFPDEATKVVSLAFATQVLPHPAEVRGRHPSELAHALAQHVLDALRGHRGPWRLHVFGQARAPRVLEAVRAELAESHAALLARLVADDTAPFSEDELFLQAMLVGSDRAWFSAVSPEERVLLRRVVSHHPGGEIPIPDDVYPPSRAFKKLLEAEAHLGTPLRSGETAVDLGASPGGWTAVALRRGLRVTAVDRSPLRDDLMQHEALTFVRGDAFAYQPPEPVDWLLCDVIAFPVRTTELLKTWLSRRWCRQFVVSVKFKGEEDYARLEEVKRILKQNTWDFCVRQLPSNGNEVCAMGWCRKPGPL